MLHKKNIKRIFLLGGIFLFSQLAIAQTTSPSYVPGDVVNVSISVLETYCDNGVSYGNVTLSENPEVGMIYAVEGNGVNEVLKNGEVKVFAEGQYNWFVNMTNNDININPVEGVFVIENVCNTDSTGTETNTSTEDNTLESLYPPSSFEVLREGEITLILFDIENITSNIVAHNIYRRCEDATWWLIGSVKTSECGGYACSYQVSDRKSSDSCFYSISSVDSSERESEKSIEKTPQTTEDSSNDGVINITQTTDTVSEVQTTDTTSETSPVVTESNITDETLTTEDVTRHVASGKYAIYLRAEEAEDVEWSIYPEGSDTGTYLGKAVHNIEKDFWEYMWDTTTISNGDYVLIPKITSFTGRRYQDAPTHVRVQNEINNEVNSDEDRKLVDIITDAAKEVNKVIAEDGNKDEAIKQKLVDSIAPHAKELSEYIEREGSEEVKKELEEEQNRAKEEMKTLLNVESSKLLHILDGDEEEFKRFENKVTISAQKSIKNVGLIANEFGINLDDEDLKQLEEAVSNHLDELEGVIKERREVLKERVGDDRVFQDSDNDGISNYDEVNIYKTNPFVTDSDGDGFSDGAEILGGFNPNNSASEAVLKYEEPRTSGYLEEDTFTVDRVAVTEKKQLNNGKEDASKILLSGNAPANSFVTIYIYSTPIIVTVKTDEQGNWIYELDKELEDGNHEVYVAITDNAGKIYAKSKPLPFIKKAAAVTVDQSALFAGENTNPSVFEKKYLYFIGLFIIAIIGWVLVFTGSKQVQPDEVV